MPSVAIAVVSFFMFLYYMWCLKKYFCLADSLLLTSILFIPTSTISILGTSYSSLPLTWHNLIIIILMLYIIIEGTLNRSYLIILFLFICFGISTSMFLPFLIDALKQLMTISLFICSFLIGKRFKMYSKNLTMIGWNFYFIGVVSMAFQVYLQRVYILSTGVIIGNYAEMGLNRIAYAGLMGDFSFAGLYLATGCLYAFLKYVDLKNWKLLFFIIIEVFLLGAILCVSARTGLVSLFVTMTLYYLFNINRISVPHLLVLIGGIITTPYILVMLMAGRSGQSLLDSSGRLENYMSSLNAFSDKYLIGYGLGLNNLYTLLGVAVPHNFFIQYLLQTGIIGTLIILSGFFKFTYEELKKSGCYKWFFLMIVVGAMFIPDIVSSRFLYAIVVLCMISASERTIKKES
ncbi:O-antigen ligase family protein [Enterococcus faecium]|uniref:O-antigen ligase family protein n=2 Tax=Enterococcus faecium TaxID=1352 RepID=UPI001C8C3619|nr:O-antigen ligase family protein [Enterococcus faecium]